MVELAERPIHDLGNDLARDGGPGVVSLWWLGQAGFAVRAGRLRVVIDPYLSDSLARKYAGTVYPHRRMMAPPVDPQSLGLIDLVLCTHGHTDHMDPDTLRPIAAAAPRCRFVAPTAEATRAIERGIPPDRLLLADADRPIVPVEGATVMPIASAHEELKRNDAGSYHFLGYVIRLGGVAIYHSGDCIPYPGLAERLAREAIDLALLPVNGRDAGRLARGVPGNFDLDEAVALCRAAGIPKMLGHHFGLFDFNTIDEATARQAIAGLPGIDLVRNARRYDLTPA